MIKCTSLSEHSTSLSPSPESSTRHGRISRECSVSASPSSDGLRRQSAGGEGLSDTPRSPELNKEEEQSAGTVFLCAVGLIQVWVC
jgi:hypothetical protein